VSSIKKWGSVTTPLRGRQDQKRLQTHEGGKVKALPTKDDQKKIFGRGTEKERLNPNTESEKENLGAKKIV